MQNMHVDSSQEAGGGIGEKPSNPVIVSDVAKGFTYASYQNAIPVIRFIRIENSSDRCLQACRLDLTATPSFLRPESWSVDRLLPGDELNLSDRKAELDAGYLAGLDEAERGEITLHLSSAGEMRDERRQSVHLLERLAAVSRSRLDGAITRARRHATTSKPAA